MNMTVTGGAAELNDTKVDTDGSMIYSMTPGKELMRKQDAGRIPGQRKAAQGLPGVPLGEGKGRGTGRKKARTQTDKGNSLL